MRSMGKECREDDTIYNVGNVIRFKFGKLKLN